MIRLILFLAGVLATAAGLHWLADRPGSLSLTWQGYIIETSVFRAVILLALTLVAAIMLWSGLRQLWRSPALIGRHLTRKRERKGLDAISTGMIALGTGDKASAMRAAVQARKSLPNEPLTHLLRAQAAQLQGDGATARRIFEAMLSSPDTEQLGLRGLYLEASKVGESEAARQFAERALKADPRLEWPAQSLFDLQCKAGDWDGALETLAIARKHGHVERKVAERRRAVLLTAQAMALEDDQPDRALEKAQEAHGLAPDLIPAAAIAGRVLAARGLTPKAAKVIDRTWKLAPHPDLAMAYAYARHGDSVSDRVARMRRLASVNAETDEGPIALASIALETRDWTTAREALTPLTAKSPSGRVCALMARIEGEGFNDIGRAREWLARAVHAPRDPAWTADGVLLDQWAPVSPVTGQFDAVQWRVPVEALTKPEAAAITQRVEDLLRLGLPAKSAAELAPVKPVTAPTVVDLVDAEPVTGAPPPKPRPAVAPAPARVNGAVSKPLVPDDFIAASVEAVDPAPAKAQLERYGLVGAKP